MVDLTEEYRNVSKGAGWRLDRSRGRLRIMGRDAGSFLHALVTADVLAVPSGGGVYAAYLSPLGRMISDMTLYRRGDSWLADLPTGLAVPLLARLDALIFTEDVRVADVSDSTGLVSVYGPEGADVVGRAFAADAAAVLGLPLRSTVDLGDVMVARTDAAAVPTFDLIMPAEEVASVTARLSRAGAIEMRDETAEVFRLEAGRPAFGVDMHAETIPLEAGLLERAISLTKGCYVGQEVIIRVLHRGGGRVAKRLMRLEAASADDAIAPGSVIVAGDREVGRVTSAAWSPSRGRAIALGYVHRDAALEQHPILIRTPHGDTGAVIVGPAG
jgi:folate-binding protein YgfZ